MLDDVVTRLETNASQSFKKAQDEDQTLKSYRVRARAGSSEYIIADGLLYRRASSNVNVTYASYVLIVPQAYERETIRAAHSSLLGGHLGIRKTTQRISKDFFIPRLKQKGVKYTQFCHECQMNKGVLKRERQPMQKPEVVDKPAFLDLTLDFMSASLPKTAKKHQYLQTIVCNSLE